MTFEELASLADPQRIENDHIKAIWYELQGNWNKAHQTVQNMSTVHAKWIHAYLHRKEGDIGNSKYWYRAAGKEYPGNIDFNKELEAIFMDL